MYPLKLLPYYLKYLPIYALCTAPFIVVISASIPPTPEGVYEWAVRLALIVALASLTYLAPSAAIMRSMYSPPSKLSLSLHELRGL